MRMRSSLVVPHQDRKIWICVFALKKETSCTYQKEERLEQKEIQEWIQALILVVQDVSPTQNLQELNSYPKYGRIILIGD
jgi:hypothetical protein